MKILYFPHFQNEESIKFYSFLTSNTKKVCHYLKYQEVYQYSKQLYQVHQYFEKYINIYKKKYINIQNKYIDIRKVYQVNQYLKKYIDIYRKYFCLVWRAICSDKLAKVSLAV